MIRRKDSFGYIDFIRGKYLQNNLEHLQSIFNEMTIEERLRVKNNNFTTLWNEMWGFQEKNNQFKGEELASQKKFEMLRQGVPMGATNDIVTMDELIDKATTKWKETEWEFPKGRRNYQEKDIDCALREFEEETGISKKNIIIVENIMPFEEIFLGSNHKPYTVNDTIPFSSTKWKSGDMYQKGIMVDDLLKNHKLIGLKRTEIFELLGRPTGFQNQNFDPETPAEQDTLISLFYFAFPPYLSEYQP
jgi:8-oxo-dGTP pyrophosphatase MutT (NUDIX family)